MIGQAGQWVCLGQTKLQVQCSIGLTRLATRRDGFEGESIELFTIRPRVSQQDERARHVVKRVTVNQSQMIEEACANQQR